MTQEFLGFGAYGYFLERGQCRPNERTSYMLFGDVA
jgi:hypothetical protein